MKNNLLLIFVFLFISLTTISVILYDNNLELQTEIDKRDQLIKKSQMNDSLNCEHTEKYVNTITKYITQDCGLLIDNKKVSLDEFIKIYSDEVNQSNILRNEVLILRDSNRVLLRQLQVINRKYSVQATTQFDGNYLVTSAESAKIDSALILLPYFRDRLSYDSVKKVWKIRVPK